LGIPVSPLPGEQLDGVTSEQQVQGSVLPPSNPIPVAGAVSGQSVAGSPSPGQGKGLTTGPPPSFSRGNQIVGNSGLMGDISAASGTRIDHLYGWSLVTFTFILFVLGPLV
jgi:hypothetical protein